VTGTGSRAPAMIVSRYARPGSVCSVVPGHTVVLTLIKKKWNRPALTATDAASAAPPGAPDPTCPASGLPRSPSFVPNPA
jgi:hypothetical protein